MEYLNKKFIWKPINRATNKFEENNRHYRKIITVIGEETLNRLKISIDNFPKCNHREYHNCFIASKDELIELYDAFIEETQDKDGLVDNNYFYIWLENHK